MPSLDPSVALFAAPRMESPASGVWRSEISIRNPFFPPPPATLICSTVMRSTSRMIQIDLASETRGWLAALMWLAIPKVKAHGSRYPDGCIYRGILASLYNTLFDPLALRLLQPVNTAWHYGIGICGSLSRNTKRELLQIIMRFCHCNALQRLSKDRC